MSVHKLHKQHSSIVMTIPKWALMKMGVCAGEYVELDDCSEFPDNDMVCMTRLELRHVRDNQNSDKQNQGG